MESLMVLLLIALCEKDGELKKKLSAALEFYRENRELLRAAAAVGEQKNSPEAEGESMRALDALLKKI